MNQTRSHQAINAIVMIIWPLLHVVIAIAGILLFQAEKRHYNFLIPIGASIPFLTGIAHILYFFPVVGMINNGDVGPETLGNFFLYSGALNSVAYALIAYGILMHAWMFFKTRENANLAEDHHS
ncbi:hypothetical protein OAK81_02770 [Verrucomicrobiales bacterium]|nr:hypothetical protein [Verrucomicrobiales bacterium]